MAEERSSASGFEVNLGGQRFYQANEEGGVQLVVVEDHVDMVDMCTLRMGGMEDQPSWDWKIGQDVDAKVGKGSDAIFSGQITSLDPGYQVEGISTMNIRALDKMHILGRGRATRFFEEMSDGDIVKKVAGEAGVPCGDCEAGSTGKYTMQRNESNVAFLKRLAARNNFVLRMDHGKLTFKKANFGGGGFTLKMGENLRSLRLSYNSVDQVQKVVCRGWDVMKKEAIVGEATTGDVQKIGGGQLGADVAAQFGKSTAYITDVPILSQDAAKAVAKAEMNRLARQFCRGSATIQGAEQVRAGTTVTIEGLQQGVNGEVFVVSSRHIISNRTGYSTEFSFCATSLGG